MTMSGLFIIGLILLIALPIGVFIGRSFEHSRMTESNTAEARVVEATKQELVREIALLKQAEANFIQERDQLKQGLNNIENELKSLTKDKSAMGADLQTAQSQILNRDSSIKACEAIGREREEEVKRLNRELTEALSKVAALQTASEKDELAQRAERQQFEESRKLLKQEFENLANRIFDSKQQAFDIRSKDGLTSLLSPFKEQLEAFRTRVDQIHTENVKESSTLKGELDRLLVLNQQITEEAANLTKALKGDKKIQGNWGEQKVQLLLEQSGLRKDHEYHKEKNFKDEEGSNLRPDFVVNLPEGKHLIVDSKVSLVDYAAYIAATDPEERERFLAAHVLALRNHIRSLSEKRYPDLIEMGSPDFTFMFLAIEPAYLAALEHSPGLFQDAYDKRIVMVTATTLLPVLRVIANLWNLQQQAQSTALLVDQAAKVYDKLRIFMEKMQKLGGQIETVQKTYQSSWDTLKDGKGSLARTVERFEQLGIKFQRRLPISIDLPELTVGQEEVVVTNEEDPGDSL